MLSSILNLPIRRRKSGPTVPSTPPPATSQEPNREEDGFILLGESESERNTVMPLAARNGTIAVPPPSYEQVNVKKKWGREAGTLTWYWCTMHS